MPKDMTKTKYTGVYARENANRRDKRTGKPDICYYVTFNENDGKKIWKKIGFKSEGYSAATANEMRAEFIQVARHGRPVEPEIESEDNNPKTFGEAWAIYSEKWLPTLKRGKDEEGRYMQHIAPRFADTPLHVIKVIDLEGFKQELLTQKGLSPKTCKHILSLMKAVYKKMAEWELYSGPMPLLSLQMPKVDNARLKFLTKQQAEEVLDALKRRNEKWWGIAAISLYSGLRLSEILSLTWGDLNIDEGILDVRFGKAGRRQAFMPDELKDFFRDMTQGAASELIFKSSRDEQITATTASEAFASVVKKLKFNDGVTDRRQKIVFHSLRHTFGSWLAIAGVPLYTIAELMGHSDIKMTERYAHLCPNTMRSAINAISLMNRTDGIAG